MPHVIRNTNDDTYWSNEHGWTDMSEATQFSDDERESFNLPQEGEWFTLEHAPLPWYATLQHVQSAAINEDNYVCECSGVLCSADAELIVKAVNSHSRLLRCLSRMSELFSIPEVATFIAEGYAAGGPDEVNGLVDESAELVRSLA